MRVRSGLRVALTVGLIALVVSTFALSATAANPTDTKWKTATIKAAGLSLRYPSTWTRYTLTKKALAAEQRKGAKMNPQLAMTPAEQAQFLKRVVFYAADLVAALAGRLESNINVQKIANGRFPSSLDEFTSGITPGLKQEGATVLNTSAVRIGGKQSFRVDFLLPVKAADGSSVVSRIGQLLVPYGRGGDVMTVGTTADDIGAQLINRVLGSVHRT